MTMQTEAPIGVFDSGVGGLTVAREIIRNLPGENIVYFGDMARVPYGSKSRQTVITYSRQIVHFLKTREVKTIVIACNTASSLALEELEKETDIPILGVVKPGVKAALKRSVNRRIGVVATSSTIESGLYQRLLKEADDRIRVFAKACPLLCPLAEEGWLDDEITDRVIRRYLEDILPNDLDTLILGCTHYPLLRSAFKRIVGENVQLVNPAYETALSLKALLAENGLENQSGKKAEYAFYSSDAPERLLEFANRVLEGEAEEAQKAEKISIERY